MATQEKLLKSLEILQIISYSNNGSDSEMMKKDKIQHCHLITQCLSNTSIQRAPNFAMSLNYAMERFFQLCDDPDSDIRMISEECINKIIRALSNENITKVLIELHKEIKRNSSARSLRAALSRFSRLAHFIRPNKGKPYLHNLFPSLIKIIDRPEEAVHETLSSSLPKIIEVLGPFSTDNDIKNLLKSFMGNISNPSSVIKRTTASSIQNICLNCKKPYSSIVYCIHILLGFVFPLDENCDTHLILGVMGVLKILLPHWKRLLMEPNVQREKEKFGTEWGELKIEKLQQIYELCIHYTNHKDHNIVNYSLETLNILLFNATPELRHLLVNPNGLLERKTQVHAPSKKKSSSQLNISSTTNESHPESELTESIRPDIAKWIDESKLSVFDTPLTKSEDFQSVESDTGISIMRSFSQMNLDSSLESVLVHKLEKSNSRDDLELSTSLTEQSFSCEDLQETISKDINIGNLYDKNVALKYCARLLAKSFLLTGVPGQCLNDRTCRISVKSSALTCFSSILKLCPEILLENLDITVIKPEEGVDQAMKDVLLFANHCDPQLRGATRTLIANFLVAGINQSRCQCESWITKNLCQVDKPKLRLVDLTSFLVSGLRDQSSLCIRLTLLSIESCIESILESEQSSTAIPVLKILPNLAKNPYWLVKVTLCDLVCSLPYITIHHVTHNGEFQNQVLHDIIFELLTDSDVRVRNAASNSLKKLIPKLYFEEFVFESTVTSKAMYYKKMLLSNLYKKSWIDSSNIQQMVEGMPFPFNDLEKQSSDEIEFALSKVVTDVCTMILSSNCKHTIQGCIEALSSLCLVFPTTVFQKSWACSYKGKFKSDETNDLLKLCVHLMINTELVYDISLHTNLIGLCSNLYAGYSVSVLKPIVDEEDITQKWKMFDCSTHAKLSDSLLRHIIKLLSIYQHIVDDIQILPPNSKPIILSLPTASPIKRRKSDLEKKFISPSKIMEDKNEKKEKEKNIYGNFSQTPHYLKIHEALKLSYSNYKTSLEPDASEKFLNLLKKSISALSILMEIGGLEEFGSIAEEILTYLNSIFRIEPSATVECVQQLLKSIFSANFVANGVELMREKAAHKDVISREPSGFFNRVFLRPYDDVTMCINTLKDLDRIECDGDSTVMGYFHRSTKRKVALARNLDKVLANYIRIFEPMVIKSLKQYTITSDVNLQGRVLQLLSQLVQLKINYCLLDSDQIFINFVISQFEYIEEGQIERSNELVPKIFQFLVQLSYSKQHSKSIIGIPKIIHLCDGLSASGQCPLSHCIPALKPVVEDIFLTRNSLNTTDVKELETTREVILAMLLKLIEYHEVVDLVVLILDDSRYCSDADKWLRWSKNVFVSIVSLLKSNKYRLESIESLNSIRKLIFAMNPNVFKPIDDIVVMLFQEPPSLGQNTSCFTRWLGKIITILLILSPVKEDVILSKILSLKNNFLPNSVFENVVITPDPLNVTNSADFFQYLSSEIILIRFIFRTLTLATKKCTLIIEEEQDNFLIEELSIFMMFCLHNFQSGFLCKTANMAVNIIEKSKYAEECDAINLEPINENFLNLVPTYPTLTFQWCYFLTLLSYEDRQFWASILQISQENHQTTSINMEIVKVGGIIVFYDYLCEKSSKDCSDISWLLDNNVNLLIDLYEESPINEFFSFIHRDLKLSNQFLTNVEHHSTNSKSTLFNIKVLKSVENAHPNLTGQLINLLLTKMLLIKESAVNKEVSKLAIRKLELLSTMSAENIHCQLSPKRFLEIMSFLGGRSDLVLRHDALFGLLHKLGSRFYGVSFENIRSKKIDPSRIRGLVINEDWYLSEIQSKLVKSKIGKGLVEILNCVSYEKQVIIMQSIDFDRLMLKDCIEFGRNIFENNPSQGTPTIVLAAVDTLHKEISDIIDRYLDKNQFQDSLNSTVKSKSSLHEHCDTPEFHKIIACIIPCLSSYLKYIPTFSSLKITPKHSVDIAIVTVTSLEFVNYLNSKNKTLNINLTDYTLRCLNFILKQDEFHIILNSEGNVSLVSKIVTELFKIVDDFFTSKQISSGFSGLIPENLINSTLGEASSQLYSLIFWMYKLSRSYVGIPCFFRELLKSIIVSLGRLSVFNPYMLVPVKAWNKGWDLNLSFPQTPAVSLPVEMLQDIEILEEYIYRISLLGWTSRQQFEETWMCLLSVLCNSPTEDSSSDEISEIFESISVAVKGITSMLIQSLYLPVPGRSNTSKLIHVSRNSKIVCDKTSMKKLKSVQQFIKNEYQESQYFSGYSLSIDSIFEDKNLEKQNDQYSFSQLSVKYFWISIEMMEDVDETCLATTLCNRRNQTLQKYGLDITSCLHFLQDFYTQLLQFQKINSLVLLHEIVNSIVILSDLFNDKTQFSWLLDLFLNLMKTHAVDDELLHQYLIVGICKATAVLNPELEIYEAVKKYLVQFLNSSNNSSRISCLHGVLYILEGCVLSNINIGGISEELQIILPCAVEYIQTNLGKNDRILPQSQEHTLLVWALAFYILENVDEIHIESTLVENVLTNAIRVLTDEKTNVTEFNCIMQGLQRLVALKENILPKIDKKVVKLSLDGLRSGNYHFSISSIQLLFCYMYRVCAEHVEPQNEQTNPENLVQTIEKFSALFEHIKKGYIFEVEMICSLLPRVLGDFFTPADILTKVIGEFLSTQQPHQKLLSRVIFYLFQSAIKQNQLTLLQDWIVFSLHNFTQNFSYPMATWCLTCFFISASSNKWLISLFPYVQTRMQRYEHEDRELLCIAGSDFYKNLSTEKQKATFRENFKMVTDLPEKPFNDLLLSL